MTDPVSVIGAAASILQLVGSFSHGLKTLRNAVAAIRDIDATLEKMETKMQLLKTPMSVINSYIVSRAANPNELDFELHDIVLKLTRSCYTALNSLEAKLPAVSRSTRTQVAAAAKLWINGRDFEQATKEIDGHIQNLTFIVNLLNLFRIDEVEDKLHQIRCLLDDTTQLRTLTHNTIPPEDERKDTAIHQNVRVFATNAATLIAMEEPLIPTWKTSEYSATLFNQEPAVMRKEQLGQELEVNRIYLERFTKYRLYEKAVEMQRRAIEIRERQHLFMTPDGERRILSGGEDHDAMHEHLADLLLQCNAEQAQKEAMSIFQSILDPPTSIQPDAMEAQSSPEPAGGTSQQYLRLHFKLGIAYKDAGQLDLATESLRNVFHAHAYDGENPKDTGKIQEVGEHLLAIYKQLAQRDDGTPRTVRTSQLQAFKRELEGALGRPLTESTEALAWCNALNITVATSDHGQYHFDIMDPDSGSSPLHRAAEKCHDKTVLQQMIENSDLEHLNMPDKETPLLVAVLNSNEVATGLLLKNGASVTARDKESQTSLHRSPKSSITRLLLEPRLYTGDDSTFPWDNDLDIDALDAYEQTALYMACYVGRERTVELLVRAGARPNIACCDKSPLEAAIESKAKRYLEDQGQERKVKIVKTLIRAGADPVPGKELLRKPWGPEKQILRALENETESLSLFSLSTNSKEVSETSGDTSQPQPLPLPATTRSWTALFFRTSRGQK